MVPDRLHPDQWLPSIKNLPTACAYVLALLKLTLCNSSHVCSDALYATLVSLPAISSFIIFFFGILV